MCEKSTTGELAMADESAQQCSTQLDIMQAKVTDKQESDPVWCCSCCLGDGFSFVKRSHHATRFDAAIPSGDVSLPARSA